MLGLGFGLEYLFVAVDLIDLSFYDFCVGICANVLLWFCGGNLFLFDLTNKIRRS